MALTDADKAKLDRVLATGVESTEFNGRRTKFRSVDDLLKLRDQVDRDTGAKRVRAIEVTASREN